MTLKGTAERWGWMSQALHWLIAVLILGLGIGGLIMGKLPKTPNYFWVYTAHKSIGISVLALAVLRLLWRLYVGAPKTNRGHACLAGASCQCHSYHALRTYFHYPTGRLAVRFSPWSAHVLLVWFV